MALPSRSRPLGLTALLLLAALPARASFPPVPGPADGRQGRPLPLPSQTLVTTDPVVTGALLGSLAGGFVGGVLVFADSDLWPLSALSLALGALGGAEAGRAFTRAPQPAWQLGVSPALKPGPRLVSPPEVLGGRLTLSGRF